MKLQRLLGILAVLLQKQRISAENLAERFEVSTRTIYRDLEALEQAGIPLVTYPGVNGGVEILDTYKLDKTVFLSDDFASILSGLQSISGAVDTAKINQTLAKLRSLIPEPQAKSIELSGKKLYVDLKPWSIHPDFQKNFNIVKDALHMDKLLKITYADKKSMSSQRVIEPHQLILKEQNWYLRAFCRVRQDFRTFLIRRITDAEMPGDSFAPRPFSDELDDFKDWTHPKMIIVEITAPYSKYQAFLQYCRPEYITSLPSGNIHVSLPFVESDFGYSVLLQLGHECEVISPAHIREELKRQISLLAERYA